MRVSSHPIPSRSVLVFAIVSVLPPALYAALALAVRIVRPSDIVMVLKLVRDRKKAA